MVEVCRGNVYLDISNEEIEKYMAKGFSLVDAKTDRIIKQSIPTSLAELQKAYSEHVDTINQLNLEIARLKSKLQAQVEGKTSTSPQGEVEKASEPEATSDWDDWSSAEEVDEKPKKKKKKSSLS